MNLRLPSWATTALGFVAGVLAILNEVSFGFNTEWRGYLSMALIFLAGLGISPLVGAQFRSALHLSSQVSIAISSALAALALFVHTFDLSAGLRAVIQGILAFAAAVGFAPVAGTIQAGLRRGTAPRRVYGWRRPLPGLTYPHANLDGLTVLAEVDPRPKMPPVFDQGQLGSCTANATAACFQYDAIQDGKDCGLLSRLWTYFFERQIEGTLGQGDVGAMGHDAFTVATHGIPLEKFWPYVISKFQVQPPNEPRAYTLTKPVKSVPQNETAIKQVLSNGQTIAFGFTVYESFESEVVAKTGIVPMPGRGEKVLGGHEVLAVGFLKAHPGFILVRNSWGDAWGIAGYFLMPVSYLTSHSLASDLRTIVRPLAK